MSEPNKNSLYLPIVLPAPLFLLSYFLLKSPWGWALSWVASLKPALFSHTGNNFTGWEWRLLKDQPPPPTLHPVIARVCSVQLCTLQSASHVPLDVNSHPLFWPTRTLTPAHIQNVISRSLRCSFEALHQNHGCFVQKEKPRQPVRGLISGLQWIHAFCKDTAQSAVQFEAAAFRMRFYASVCTSSLFSWHDFLILPYPPSTAI